MFIDIKKILKKYKIKPRGVIHVGMHEGNEVIKYFFLGIKNVLGFEANKTVFNRLKKKLLFNILPYFKLDIFNLAVCNSDGLVDFYITSSDQSSSLLKLKKHLEIYPDIIEIESTKVNAITLDKFFRLNKNLKLEDYNFLNMDIQGSELLALKGAEKVLQNIDIINIELNFDELYENCALYYQIDDFLLKFNFKRIETFKKFHDSWGDGVYIKEKYLIK